ncbi:Hsp70 family protein [Aspergillus lucknowensis]|uniref:Uncharacterized protein n=1 Tax=Aspergillus lucknowensis TaxID=176173 RepID=A0ABR4LY90_9EURO
MTLSSWFKLFLDADRPSLARESDAALHEVVRMGILRLPQGKTGVDLTADFLTRILETIHRVVCPNRDPATRPLIVSITTPVTWRTAAVDSRETAASRAGFGQRTIDEVRLTTEPEAAMYHVVESLGNRFEVDEVVLVCDVGAGTTMDPALLQNNLYYSNGNVRITKDDLQCAFGPVVHEITDLIELEIRLTQMHYPGVKIDHLVFVGGLIESAYVRFVLGSRFGTRYKLAIPGQPRLAVTRGAALRETVDGRRQQA